MRRQNLLVLLIISFLALYPPEKSHSASPTVIINEFLTGKTGETRNEFIELFNQSDSPINLSLWRLTKKTVSGSESNLVAPDKFSGSIPARGYFLIAPPDYKDHYQADLAYSGSSYSVSSNNSLLVYDQGGNLVDKVGYGTASDYEGAAAPDPGNDKGLVRMNPIKDTDDNLTDFSINDLPMPQNSLSPPEPLNDPDPDGNTDPGNTDPPSEPNYSDKIRLNEVCPYPKEGEEEFIELISYDEQPVDLSGWIIEDGAGHRFIIPSGSTIANGNLLSFAGNFYLNNSGDETVSLFDPSGTLADVLLYSGTRQGHSWGFDGTDWAWTSDATPGETNRFPEDIPDPEPDPEYPPDPEDEPDPRDTDPPETAYSKKLRLNELLPDPKGADEKNEYIELYNSGKETISLENWTLKDSSKTKFIFGKYAEILGGHFLAVYRSDFKFALNNSGKESVFLLDPSGAVASELSYTGSKSGLSYGLDGTAWRWGLSLTPGEANRFDPAPDFNMEIDEDIYKDIYAEFEIKSDEKDIKVAWDFGDKHKSYLKKVRHKYSEEGAYKASVKISFPTEEVTKNFTVEVAKFPSLDVSIIALLPDPTGKDTGAEWIEVANNSQRKLNLKGWSIASGQEKLSNHPISEGFLLKAGESKKLTRENSKFTLDNKQAKVELRYPDGRAASIVEYAKEKVAEGEIYEKVDGEWKWINETPIDDAPATSEEAAPTGDNSTDINTPGEAIAYLNEEIENNLGKYSSDPEKETFLAGLLMINPARANSDNGTILSSGVKPGHSSDSIGDTWLEKLFGHIRLFINDIFLKITN